MTHIHQIAQWCHGSWLQQQDNSLIKSLIIDSRKVDDAETALFIALPALRRDGHQFIADAYEKGIRNFLVSQSIDTSPFKGANFILVPHTQKALQTLVAAYRKQFNIPVIGITGSNGKTVVKEWLFQMLSARMHVVRSPKSFNSQIGVPLSVWLLEPEHQIAIFEAGISQPDEMFALESMIHPTIGIFTNIGEAHSEGFLSQQHKINEKLKLFTHVEQLVYCSDYPELNESVAHFKHQAHPQLKLFTWSQKHEADLMVQRIEIIATNLTKIVAQYQQQIISIQIPFTDPASIENAIHCWCMMLLLQLPQNYTEQSMLLLHPVAMRLQLRHGINDSTLIDDTYNSDLTSLSIALDFLEQQKQHSFRTVILSDMLQMGKSDMELYEEVSHLISRRNVQRFIGVGPAIYRNKSVFKKYKKLKTHFFKSTEELLQNFHLLQFEKEAILLKGARSFAFEKLGQLLEQKVHQTVMSINLSSLTHNLNVFRAQLPPNVKTMAMVKAFSYGSGSFEIAHLLQYSGVDYLTVAYTDEGVSLRKAGISLPIMVMSPDIASFDRMIAWKLEPEIFNLRSLQSFLDIANMMQVVAYPIHIKLDTGMHRLGFEPQDMEQLGALLHDQNAIKVVSVFSHLAGSENPTYDAFTQEQAFRFLEMNDKIQSGLGYQPIRHLCNSAAIARHPNLHFEMVRLGLGLYGIDGSGILQKKLKQIGTLKTIIAQVKQVAPGETIGYGRAGNVKSEMRIATISIGYADGYPRALSNGNGYVLIHGKQAPIVGVVCMDMCMVDISNIPEAQEGDEVIVFGPQLPITQLADWSGTISYEMMTGISQRVKRVYVNED